jgi:hypothetical protein
MICTDCAKSLTEVKTMGGFGPCCVCGQTKPDGVTGPITEMQQTLLKAMLPAQQGAPK